MELPGLGENCKFASCKQLDFLPFLCNHCHFIYCKEHYMPNKHQCKFNDENASKNKQSVKYYHCSYEMCRKISSIEMNCQVCNLHHCIQHRHSCTDKKQQERDKEYEKWDAPKRQFEAAKAKVDEQVDKAISQAKKKASANKTAMKIQVMKLKGKAVGLKTISSTERIYFLVHYPLTIAEKSKAVFVSKQWTLGRVIDAIAEACDVPNRNSELNAKKLRLFHHVDGQLLCAEMEKKMDQLLNDGTVVDGETLILEYCIDTQPLKFQLENLALYKN